MIVYLVLINNETRHTNLNHDLKLILLNVHYKTLKVILSRCLLLYFIVLITLKYLIYLCKSILNRYRDIFNINR